MTTFEERWLLHHALKAWRDKCFARYRLCLEERYHQEGRHAWYVDGLR